MQGGRGVSRGPAEGKYLLPSVMRWEQPGGLGTVFKNPLTIENGKVDF